MRTSTFIFTMAGLALGAAVFVGCETLFRVNPETGISPIADAGITAVGAVAQNPTVIGVVEGVVGAAAVIAAAFFGRKKIAAGARVAGRVVGIVKKKVD